MIFLTAGHILASLTVRLDTSAVLIHYRQEPGCERILSLFDDPASVVLLSSLSLAEFGRVLRSTGLKPADADATIEAYLPLFSEVLPVDDRIARASLRLVAAVPDRIPTVDSLIAASVQQRGACLVHRDGHFRAIPVALLQTIDLKPSNEYLRAPGGQSVVR